MGDGVEVRLREGGLSDTGLALKLEIRLISVPDDWLYFPLYTYFFELTDFIFNIFNPARKRYKMAAKFCRLLS